MKTIKKIIAVIMVLVTLFCSFAFVVSAEDAKATDEDEYVATVYVCQEMQPPYIMGHTWLYFVNLTNHEITVGLYTLPKGQGVSIGTYGLSIKGGRGLYYNIEGYRYNHPTMEKDFVCLKKNVTQKQLETMSVQITRHGVWSFLLNCSFAPFMIWDSVLGQFLPYLVLPILARLCIIMYPQHEKGFYLYDPDPDQIFKQVGWGKNAYLIPADPTVK